MTKGEQIIGKFNNENRTDVDLIEEKGKDPRRKATAITDIGKDTMMAVKSLFD